MHGSPRHAQRGVPPGAIVRQRSVCELEENVLGRHAPARGLLQQRVCVDIGILPVCADTPADDECPRSGLALRWWFGVPMVVLWLRLPRENKLRKIRSCVSRFPGEAWGCTITTVSDNDGLTQTHAISARGP